MNIGIIGDTHEPVSRAGYLDFCSDTFEKYHVDWIVHIGDLVDWHGVSFHAKQPQCPGMADEYELAYEAVQRWRERFPNVKWCIGNHDERPARLALSVGMAEFCLKPYNELWGVPGWEMDFEFELDETIFMHGTGRGGIHPAWNAMNKKKMSVVMGHCHTRAGMKWSTNFKKRYFCLDTGCGINDREFQFAYGKNTEERPVLSCAVVEDGQPHSIAMKCGMGEKYHDSNFIDPNKKPLVFLGKHIGRQYHRPIDDNPMKLNVSKPKRKSRSVAVHYTGKAGDADPVCGTYAEVQKTTDFSKVTCKNCLRQ